MACLNQVWPADFLSQIDYIDTLLIELEEVDATHKTVVIYQDTEPNTTQIQAAWEAETGLTTPPPVGATFVWFRPATGVHENIFMPVDDLAANASTNTVYSYHTKDRSLDFVFLEETYTLDDLAVASMTITGIDQTGKHLFMTHSLRGLDAGTSVNFTLRSNNIATGNYANEHVITDGAAAAAIGGITQTGWATANGVTGAGTNQPSSFGSGYIFLTNYAATGDDFCAIMFGRRACFEGVNPIAAANKNHLMHVGLSNILTLLPITELDMLGPAATFRRGSKMSLWAWK